MIKGLGYLKYLKLSLIGFGISCFMVLGGNYVNASVEGFVVSSNTSTLSQFNTGFNMNFNSNGLLYTSYLGEGKGVLQFSNGNYFFWLDDGTPYISLNLPGWEWGGNDFMGQGVPDDFLLCDSFSSYGSGQSPSNCVNYNFNNHISSFLRVYQSSNSWFYGRFAMSYSSSPTPYGSLFCFSSSSLGKSVCIYGCRNGYCDPGNYDLIGGATLHSNLSNSQNFGLEFENIPVSRIGRYPGYNGGSIDGSSYNGDFNTITGNVVNQGCTKSQALQWYRCNGYKTRMCYSSYGNVDDLYTGPGNASAYDLTGVDIEDVWFNSAWYRRNGQTGSSMGYSEWFSYWRKTYNVYKQNPQHTNPFLGVPVSIFTLMGNVNSYGNPYTDSSIIEFCDLSLYTANYNNPYTGVAYNAVCSMSPIELIDCQASNGLNPDDGYPGDGYTNGTVGPVGSSWDGITNRTGYHDKPGISTSGEVADSNDLNTFDDGSTFLNNFFNKLQDNFKYPLNTGTARIPSYIILFLCAVILFKFLRK